MHINETESINSSMPEYWENSYKSGEMGWDVGCPTPIFTNWINAQTNPLSICILGAGNGWDALHFAEKGHRVTAVDFAESAVLNMKASAEKRGLKLDIIHADIFDLDKLFTNTFDIILEYTCFCAIDPAQRDDYIRIVNHLLNPSGKFVGLLFPIDKELNDDGPPYGVDINTTLESFAKYFTLVKKEMPTLSIERRKGREIFVILKKNGN
ncbi:MAG: methyltransferase domain-containing protein [Candidatus Marinimicrobia bacterium]|nr:methyltransferase domain-containing protein [Candidatus Neomarinimicrobiota bacterium]